MTATPGLRLVVMAKAPQPGLAKTRLIPLLGADGSARLAHQLLQRTLALALEADIGQVELCATPAPNTRAWDNIDLPNGLNYSDQGGGDLGERMARSSARALASTEAVILIGTDCVEMSADLLRQAAKQLHSSDAVIYPTHDGGYALLGLRRFSPILFEGIPWSTDSVYKLTLERFAQLGWSPALGETLRDIDEPEDLRHLSDFMATLDH